MAENVLSILKMFLEHNDFDGLYNVDGECACETNNLNPCDECFSTCVPGYKTKCDCGDHDFHIVKDEPIPLKEEEPKRS